MYKCLGSEVSRKQASYTLYEEIQLCFKGTRDLADEFLSCVPSILLQIHTQVCSQEAKIFR